MATAIDERKNTCLENDSDNLEEDINDHSNWESSSPAPSLTRPRPGVWDVVLDLVTCFPLPKWIHRRLLPEPKDELIAYARAVSLYGHDSDEACAILHKRNGDTEFLQRAKILAGCGASSAGVGKKASARTHKKAKKRRKKIGKGIKAASC